MTGLEFVERILDGDDRYTFHLMIEKAKNTNSIYKTDGKDFIFIDARDGYPAWLYAKNTDSDSLNDVISYIKQTKKEQRIVLASHHSKWISECFGEDDIIEVLRMNSYCYDLGGDNEIIQTHNLDIEVENKTRLINEAICLYKQARKEIRSELISDEKAFYDLTDPLCDNHFYYGYLNGVLVTMFRYFLIDGFARIGDVIVRNEYRGIGVASRFVSGVARKLFEEGYIPVLYADAENDISNKVYCKCGFRQTGKVSEYLIRKI